MTYAFLSGFVLGGLAVGYIAFLAGMIVERGILRAINRAARWASERVAR